MTSVDTNTKDENPVKYFTVHDRDREKFEFQRENVKQDSNNEFYFQTNHWDRIRWLVKQTDQRITCPISPGLIFIIVTLFVEGSRHDFSRASHFATADERQDDGPLRSFANCESGLSYTEVDKNK